MLKRVIASEAKQSGLSGQPVIARKRLLRFARNDTAEEMYVDQLVDCGESVTSVKSVVKVYPDPSQFSTVWNVSGMEGEKS
jgi:hypothetical protein